MSYRIKITSEYDGKVTEKKAKNLKEVIQILTDHIAHKLGDDVQIEKKQTQGLFKGNWETFWLW